MNINNIVNATPHSLTIRGHINGDINIAPGLHIVRAQQANIQQDSIVGIPVIMSTFSVPMVPEEIVSLPIDTIVIVSMIALQGLRDYPPDNCNHLFFFAPGLAIRDDLGNIVCCQGLTTL